MNYYETLYIIHPALDAGRVKEMVLSVNQTLEKNSGTVATIDVWGKKKLAYEIDKQKYGTYVLIQFTGDGSGNSKFNVELEHNPNVLAYLTLKIDENKVSNQSLTLDEQISGDNPSSAKPKEEKTKSEKATGVVEADANNSSEDNDKTTDQSAEEDSAQDDEKVVAEESSQDDEIAEEESKDNSEAENTEE